jgi:hypothetical protein
MIYDDGTNVGINTTSPVAKLTILSPSTGRVLGANTDFVIFSNDTASLGALAEIRFNFSVYPATSITAKYSEYTEGPPTRVGGDLIFGTKTSADAGMQERMVIKNNGNVGIGIPSPNAKLHIANLDSGADGLEYQRWSYTSGSTGTYDLILKQTVTSGVVRYNFSMRNAATAYNNVLVLDRGSVGIGTTDPAYKLDVDGTIRATGDVIAYSDVRVKENVQTVENALSKVISLRGVTYTRNDIEDKSRKIGVIAQEVLEVLPEVVQQDNEGNYSVSYGNIVGLLIEAIKEQQNEIKNLKNKL